MFGKPSFWKEQRVGLGDDGKEARGDSGLLIGGDILGVTLIELCHDLDPSAVLS